MDLLEHTSSLTASLPSPPAPWAYLDRCRCGPFTASGLQSAHPLSPLPTPAPPGRTLTGAGVVPSLHPVASASQISMMTRLLLTKGVMRGFWKKDDSLRVGWSAGGRGRFVRGAGERVGVGEGRVPGTLDLVLPCAAHPAPRVLLWPERPPRFSLELDVGSVRVRWQVPCESTLEVKHVVHGALEGHLEVTARDDTWEGAGK